GVVQGLRVAAPLLPQVAQVDVGVGLCGLVAGVGGQVQGVAEVGVGVVEAAQPSVGVGEIAVGAGRRGRGGRAVGGGLRGGGGGGGALGWRKISRVQVSCQVWVSKPVAAAWSMAASSTGCSTVNQSRACWSSAGCCGVTPGWGGVRVIGSRAGSSSRLAVYAGCREGSRTRTGAGWRGVAGGEPCGG